MLDGTTKDAMREQHRLELGTHLMFWTSALSSNILQLGSARKNIDAPKNIDFTHGHVLLINSDSVIMLHAYH